MPLRPFSLVAKRVLQGGEFLGVVAVDAEILFDGGDLLGVEAAFGELGFYFVEADFVQFVDGDGDIGHFMQLPRRLRPARPGPCGCLPLISTGMPSFLKAV
jgi:hypothetical protein